MNTKKNTKIEKKLVTIDITDFYEKIKTMAKDEIRSVEEQVKYLIKKSIDSQITTVTHIHTYEPSYPNITYPSKQPRWGDDWNTVYCSAASDSAPNGKSINGSDAVDVFKNEADGCYSVKNDKF